MLMFALAFEVFVAMMVTLPEVPETSKLIGIGAFFGWILPALFLPIVSKFKGNTGEMGRKE